MKATIKDGRTELTTNSNLTFVHPAYEGTHAECMQQIMADGLQTPTYAQIIDLVYEIIIKDPKNKYSQEIRQIMRDYQLRADTGLLYLLDGRVFVQDRPTLDPNGLPIMEESELESKLQARDSSVRLVEPGFKKGEQTVFQLAKNKFLIGLADEERAEKVAKMAEIYKLNPCVYALTNIDQPTTRVSALEVFAWNCGNGLIVNGDVLGDSWCSRAFGVLVAEGDA